MSPVTGFLAEPLLVWVSNDRAPRTYTKGTQELKARCPDTMGLRSMIASPLWA